jgi:hypothetical protein
MTQPLKWKLLAGLLIVWMVLIGVRFMSEPDRPRRSGHTPDRHAVRIDQADSTKSSRNSDESAGPGSAFREPKNIFLPLGSSMKQDVVQRHAPPTDRKTGPASSRPTPPAPAVVAHPPAPPPNASGPSPAQLALEQMRRQRQESEARARQEMEQVRFLGYLSNGGAKQAVLGKGNTIFMVDAGDLIDRQIEVAVIDAAEIVLRHRGVHVDAHLPLGKDK